MKIDFISKYKYLILIVLLSTILMFPNLGNRYLDGDEAHTALIAQSIQENGLPYAYYNNQLVYSNQINNLMHGTDEHPQISENHLVRHHSWSYFYLAAASFSLFGISNFTARLPFAVIGILVIVLFYFFSKKLINNESTALLATVLLATSVSFYLFSREPRYFSLMMLAVICVLYSYVKFIEKEKGKNKKLHIPSILFVLSLTLLFYTNYAIFFALVPGILAHFFLFKHYKTKLYSLILSLCAIFIFTFPWFYFLDLFSYSSGELAKSLSYFFYAATGFFYLVIVFGFPYLFFFFIPSLLKDKKLKQNYVLLFLVIISSILVLSINNEPPPVRYLIAIFPLICLINASIITKIKEKKKILAYAIIFLLIFTNLLSVFPFNFFSGIAVENLPLEKFEQADAPHFIEQSFRVRLPFADYLYEITHDYDNGGEMLVNYFREHGGKTFISSADGITRLILFYTNMNYIEKIESDTPADYIIFWPLNKAPPILKEKEKEYEEFINSNVDLSKYEKVTLNMLIIRSAETPNPVHHRFKTDRNGEIIFYKLKK